MTPKQAQFFLCGKQPARSKPFPVNQDRQIFYCGVWRGIASVIKKRLQERDRAQQRMLDPEKRKKHLEQKRDYGKQVGNIQKRTYQTYYTEEQKKRYVQRRMERSRLNRKRENELARIRWKEHLTENRAKERLRRRRRNPAHGLVALLYACTRGDITFTELDRRYGEAFKRADEIYRSKQERIYRK